MAFTTENRNYCVFLQNKNFRFGRVNEYIESAKEDSRDDLLLKTHIIIHQ